MQPSDMHVTGAMYCIGIGYGTMYLSFVLSMMSVAEKHLHHSYISIHALLAHNLQYGLSGYNIANAGVLSLSRFSEIFHTSAAE